VGVRVREVRRRDVRGAGDGIAMRGIRQRCVLFRGHVAVVASRVFDPLGVLEALESHVVVIVIGTGHVVGSSWVAKIVRGNCACKLARSSKKERR
jgi:hypothetical protein